MINKRNNVRPQKRKNKNQPCDSTGCGKNLTIKQKKGGKRCYPHKQILQVSKKSSMIRNSAQDDPQGSQEIIAMWTQVRVSSGVSVQALNRLSLNFRI